MIRKDKIQTKTTMSESGSTDSGTVAIISEVPATDEVWSETVLDIFGSSDNVVTLNEEYRS